MHFTFVLLLAWVALGHYAVHHNPLEAVAGVAIVLALFGIVVLHELGHALVARRFGIRTQNITLLPIGGVARLERIPEDPRQELAVAVAGPAVNVVLALILYVVIVVGRGLASSAEVLRLGGVFLDQLLWVNVSLVIFNLLPAFPMDGGRVLRAVLAMRLDYVRATQIAATIGQAMAILFGFVGFLVNPILVFISLFVWLGASQEASMVLMRSALKGIPVRQGMITEFHVVHPNDPLAVGVDHVVRGFQHDFPVVDEAGSVVGILTRNDLIAALAKDGPKKEVKDVMQCEFVTAHPCEMLQTAFNRLQQDAVRTLPVVEHGRLLGLLTADNLAEVLMIQDALRERSSKA
jgi:Zn-dependent protease/CBS domain-containing protein